MSAKQKNGAKANPRVLGREDVGATIYIEANVPGAAVLTETGPRPMTEPDPIPEAPVTTFGRRRLRAATRSDTATAYGLVAG
jgi:hypothetical protein